MRGNKKHFALRTLFLFFLIGLILSGCSSNNVQPISEGERSQIEPEEVIENNVEEPEEVIENNVEEPEEVIENNVEEPEEVELIVENKNEVLIEENFTGVTIANWNLQIFGKSKASNETLLDFYADIIDEYDIVFVQEIRDSSETAFPKLCDKLPEYNCEVSSRAGRSSSKEQYGIIYRDGINIIEFKDYNPDLEDRWERPPVMVTFEIGNYSLDVYNIHTKPDDVESEMDYLEDIVVNEGNVLIFGDLNADCSYYNNDKETEFDAWNWIINDDEDTTVSATDCAYDRIILNSDSNEEFTDYGIYKNNIDKEISDHYLIWISFGVDDFKPEVSIVNETIEEENESIVEEEVEVSIVKMSNSGICHDESSSYYEKTIYYTAYETIDECLEAGGRLPK